LEGVASTIVDLCGARSGSIHLLRRPFEVPNDTHRYTYNVVVGRAVAMAKAHTGGDGGIADLPRRGGLGDRALRDARPLYIPDPERGDRPDALATFNEKIWRVNKVRSMAAFPLLSRGDRGGPR